MAKKVRNSELDWENLNAILQFKPTCRLCSDYLGVSEDKIQDHIKKKFNLTFTEYRDKIMAPMKIRLQQKAIAEALDGNSALLIFCLKNLCEWEDKKNVTVEAKESLKDNLDSMKKQLLEGK